MIKPAVGLTLALLATCVVMVCTSGCTRRVVRQKGFVTASDAEQPPTSELDVKERKTYDEQLRDGLFGNEDRE